jgi:hypothetical protein
MIAVALPTKAGTSVLVSMIFRVNVSTEYHILFLQRYTGRS